MTKYHSKTVQERKALDAYKQGRKRKSMCCPYCGHRYNVVIDSRERDKGALVKRRRSCVMCRRRWTTVEAHELPATTRSFRQWKERVRHAQAQQADSE